MAWDGMHGAGHAHEPWDKARAAAVIAAGLDREGPLLPLLHDLMATFGHVPEAAVPMLAHALNLSRAEVHGVVTFYHDFRRLPAGRHTLRLCRAESCQAMGAVELENQAMRRLGISLHETTPDGRVTLEPVYCLGLCALSPAALVDGEVVGRLTPARLDATLAALTGAAA